MGSSASTRNFGMRRFTNLVRDASKRAPAAVALQLGSGVEIDIADTERVRGADNADGVGITGTLDVRQVVCGIVWYEHDAQTTEGRAAGSLNVDLDTAPAGRMVQILHGKGAKVWLKNTAANTAEAGLNFTPVRAAVTMVNGLGSAGVAVGDMLGWHSANSEWTVTTDASEGMLVVTKFDDTLETLDAEFLV